VVVEPIEVLRTGGLRVATELHEQALGRGELLDGRVAGLVQGRSLEESRECYLSYCVRAELPNGAAGA
jgi:hypothetical protein